MVISTQGSLEKWKPTNVDIYVIWRLVENGYKTNIISYQTSKVFATHVDIRCKAYYIHTRPTLVVFIDKAQGMNRHFRWKHNQEIRNLRAKIHISIQQGTTLDFAINLIIKLVQAFFLKKSFSLFCILDTMRFPCCI
jgi:hypothetical protein